MLAALRMKTFLLVCNGLLELVDCFYLAIMEYVNFHCHLAKRQNRLRDKLLFSVTNSTVGMYCVLLGFMRNEVYCEYNGIRGKVFLSKQRVVRYPPQ